MIYIIGYKGISLASKIIRKFTLGEYSHVEWLLDPTTLKGFGAFEEIGGVGYTGPHLHKKGTKYTIWTIQCTERQKSRFIDFHLQKEGCKYDWFGILGFARFRNTNNPNKWFCSELETMACKDADIPLFNWDTVAPGLTSPNRFAMSPLLNLFHEGVT